MTTRILHLLVALQSTVLAMAAMIEPPTAHADSTAYLINVTVRPGYHFANAQDAIGYGQLICDKVSQGRSYGQVIGDVKTDFSTADEYQASYLIAQAVNELCPALIWQLRNSAAHYRPAEAP
jgi:Protein of unknown function (DUF732)